MDCVLHVFVPVLGLLPSGWFESVVVRMVLADLHFGLVSSESLCPLVGHIRVYFEIYGARMLIVDHCFYVTYVFFISE